MKRTFAVIENSETDSEYVLFIPLSYRHRAENVASKAQGGGNDEKRGRWVFPRTDSVYALLLSEFHDDVSGGWRITKPRQAVRPPAPPTSSTGSAVSENGMVELLRSVQRLAATSREQTAEQVQALQLALDAKQGETVALRQHLSQLEADLARARADLQMASSEITALTSEKAALTAEVKRLSTEVGDSWSMFPMMAKSTAKEAAGHHPQFCTLVDHLDFNGLVAIEVEKELNNHVRNIVNWFDQTADLRQLLNRAEGSNRLGKRAIELAHVLRKQRNVVAHETIDSRTRQAQDLMCLYAAALLWAELPR